MFGGHTSSAVLEDLRFSTLYSISVAGLALDEELDKVGPVLVETPIGRFRHFVI